MKCVLWVMVIQAALGAFDTLYYHEWRGRLPAHHEITRTELRLHSARSFIYAVLFVTLPWFAWRGVFAIVLTALLAVEVVITLVDFAVEERVRATIGGLPTAERSTHAVMAIVYGAMLAYLLPAVWVWAGQPTRLELDPVAVHPLLRAVLGLFAAGVLASAIRDLLASSGHGVRTPGSTALAVKTHRDKQESPVLGGRDNR